MIRGFRTALFSASIVVLSAGASAQEVRVTQDKPAEDGERAGAVDRSPITSQVDVQPRRRAGAAFGFANSLYNNPKEPGVDDDLSDQWFEGYVKPALSGTYTFASSSETLRQGERGRRAHLWLGAGGIRRGRLVVRARGSLHRLAIREVD